MTFFLFGNVYKEHWKNQLGIVIGLLNPSVMDKAEKVGIEELDSYLTYLGYKLLFWPTFVTGNLM